MLSSSKCLLLAALISLLLLHLCSHSEAASNFDCCLQYTDRRLHTKHIKGFMRQHANEACDIDAVIFHTRRGLFVCADPKMKWVTYTINFLSQNAQKKKI